MSEDLIKRSDAIAELWDMTTEDCPNPGAAVGKCMEAIRHLPSADRPQGYWIKVYIATYRCSECGKTQIADDESELNYCCCCGSHNKIRKVIGAEDEESV